MIDYLPLLVVGAIIGTFTTIFIIAFATMKNKKETIGFERHMKDGEITKRLLRYARPHIKSFIAVLLIMLFSIAYDIVSPLLMGEIQDHIKAQGFELPKLYIMVALYASILVVSLICSYVQAIILQKTGQKILSRLREDVFTHIESLSHEQLNEMPVGKLVTRVANDTGSISMMFTNIIVNLIKNCFVVVGILVAMLCVN